jgi:hypothetical protein
MACKYHRYLEIIKPDSCLLGISNLLLSLLSRYVPQLGKIGGMDHLLLELKDHTSKMARMNFLSN